MTKKIKFLLDGLILIAFVLLVCYVANRSGFTVFNGDGYSHATKMKFVSDFWPNINWVYFWGNGIPVFMWYGFMPMLPMVLFYKIFNSAALSINAMNILTFVMIAGGIYGIVYEVTKSRLAALLAAFMCIPSPGLWYRILVGTSTRTFGDGFTILTLWMLIRFFRQEKEKVASRMTWFGLALAAGMAFQAHFFTVLITGLFVGMVVLFVADSWGERIKVLFITFLPAFLLAAYFLLPYLLTGDLTKASSQSGFYTADPINLKLLFYSPPGVKIVGGGFLPFYIPMMFLLTVLTFKKEKFWQTLFVKKVFLAYLALFVFFMLYGTAIFFGLPGTWYNIGFVPDEVFEFLSFIVPVIIAIGLWIVAEGKFFRIVVLESLAVIIAFVFWQYPMEYPLRDKVLPQFDFHQVYDITPDWSKHLLTRFAESHKNEKNYRYAHSSSEMSLYYNYEYQTPQNREFFPHGVMYPNWRSWQENAIYGEKWNDKGDETKFLLDWFAIRWLTFIPPTAPNETKYLNDPDYHLETYGFTNNAELNGVYNFEYQKPTPILTTTNTPTILVIGEKENDQSYGPIIRNLASLNLNSQYLIPIRGENYLDDYKLNDLTKFPLLILYQYHLKNPVRVAGMLKSYLEGGGKVIIETTSFVDPKSKTEFEKVLGFATKMEEVKGSDWNFEQRGDGLMEGVELSAFAPPIFEDAPWKVNYLEESSLQGEQKAVLLSGNKVIIFRQKVDKGELLWSGMNLPYHALSYENKEEKNFLARIIFSLLGKSQEATTIPKNKALFINPQKRAVEITEAATGVLFKENYFFNWHAKYQNGDKTETLEIYPAGLDFMYIPLKEVKSGGKVIVYYKRSTMEVIATLLSIVTFVSLVILIFSDFGLGQFKAGLGRIGGGYLKKIGGWWSRDDEEG
jgi:hypothetical protein